MGTHNLLIDTTKIIKYTENRQIKIPSDLSNASETEARVIQKYFMIRSVLIRNKVEPSVRNMAIAYKMAKTTFQRKIKPYILSIQTKTGTNVFPLKAPPVRTRDTVVRHTGGLSANAGVSHRDTDNLHPFLYWDFVGRLKLLNYISLYATDLYPYTETSTYVNEDLIDFMCIQGLPFRLMLDYSDDFQFEGEHIKDLLSVGLYSSLKKHGHFASSTGFKTGYAYANAVNNLYYAMSLRGYRVHSDNSDLRYLQKHDKKYSFTALFERKGNYLPGLRSSKTWFTNYSEMVILPDALSFVLEMPFASIIPDENDIVVTTEMIKSLTIQRDLFILMSQFKGLHAGSFVIHTKKLDEQDSRVYSVWTSISSKSRLALGFNNYDIDSALQSIVFNFLDVSHYPEHEKLVSDKKVYRQLIMSELDCDYNRAKRLLSAADNGQENSARSKSPTLMAYSKECEQMVDEFTKLMKETRHRIYTKATRHAKHLYNKVWNRDKKKYDFIYLEEYNKYSLFFFLWSQIEREIRDVMISVFENPYQVLEVHDAVYSRETVDNKTIENAIFQKLGYIITISN